MKFFFLDMPPEPTVMEKVKSNSGLILVALLALAALIVFFIWRRKKQKEKRS